MNIEKLKEIILNEYKKDTELELKIKKINNGEYSNWLKEESEKNIRLLKKIISCQKLIDVMTNFTELTKNIHLTDELMNKVNKLDISTLNNHKIDNDLDLNSFFNNVSGLNEYMESDEIKNIFPGVFDTIFKNILNLDEKEFDSVVKSM